jgi:hypothetical protein
MRDIERRNAFAIVEVQIVGDEGVIGKDCEDLCTLIYIPGPRVS